MYDLAMSIVLTSTAHFYLDGREDAAEDFDAREFDLEAIARQALGHSENLREIIAQAIRADLATDAHDGTKADWLADHEADCSKAGLDPELAYVAWCRGYVDQGAWEIESDIEHDGVFEEVIDEVTAVETPSGRASARRAAAGGDDDDGDDDIHDNPATDRATDYGDWFKTGIQDCENSWDATELDDEINLAAVEYGRTGKKVGDLAARAVKDYWRAAEAAGSKEVWLDQNADDVKADGLRVERAYQSWADGWRTRAVSYAAAEIVKRAKD